MAQSGSTVQDVAPVLELSKTCKRCDQIKEESLFVKQAGRYKSWCKECENARRRASYVNERDARTARARKIYAENPTRQLIATQKWRAKNLERYAAYTHSWYKSNPEAIKRSRMRRHAKTRDAGLFKITTKELIKLRSQPCFYCGSKQYIEIDHRVPVSRGGAHSIGNLVSACRPCNRSKTNKFVTEWNLYKRKLNDVR